MLRRVVDLIKATAPGGDLSSTLETIENALRADQAKMIEAERGPPTGALAPDDTRIVPRVSRRSAPLLVPDPAKPDRLADQHRDRKLQCEPDETNGPHRCHVFITPQSRAKDPCQ